MSAEIWVAIITSAFSFLGVIITVIWGNKKNAKRSEEQTQLTIYRIGELEKKQDKYNHLQERTAKLEKYIAVMQEDMKSIREKMAYLHDE